MISNRKTRKQLGEAIRLVRQARGLTQTELAGSLGMRPSEIGQIEEGIVGFSTGLQYRLTAALEVPLPVLNLIAAGVEPSKYEGEQLVLVEKLSRVALEEIGGRV